MFNFPYFGYPYNRPYYQYYNKPVNYVDIQKKALNQVNYKANQDSQNLNKENCETNQSSQNLNNENCETNQSTQNLSNENRETNQKSQNSNKEKVQRDLTSLDNKSNDTPIFEIFGFKLYSDDLIILAVLFLLYEQNVKDEMLYIILFLLLLS